MTLEDLMKRFQSASESTGCSCRELKGRVQSLTAEPERAGRTDSIGTACSDRRNGHGTGGRDSDPLASIESFVSMLEGNYAERICTECAVVESLRHKYSSVWETYHAAAGMDAGPTTTRRDSSIYSADRRAKTDSNRNGLRGLFRRCRSRAATQDVFGLRT